MTRRWKSVVGGILIAAAVGGASAQTLVSSGPIGGPFLFSFFNFSSVLDNFPQTSPS